MLVYKITNLTESLDLRITGNCILGCLVRPHKNKSHAGYTWQHLDDFMKQVA